jgi:two-component system, NarL family, sensor kinase
LLFYTGESMYVNRKSDSAMINMHTQFLQKHKNDISDRFRSGLMLNLGILYYYNSNIDSSLSVLTKTTQIPHHDYHTLVNISTAYNELGYNYTELGKHDKALFSTFQALDGYTKLSDTLGIGGAYDAISKVYIALEDYSSAEKYIDKAVETLRSGGFFSSIFEVYAGKLELYQLTDNSKLYPFVDTLYSFYQKEDFQNDFYKMTAFSWKASKYLEEKNTKEAGKLIAETLPIFNSSKEKFLYGKYIETVSIYDQLIGNQTIDSKVYREGLVEYKSSKNIIGQLACYGGLMDEALRINDYKNAYLYSQEYNHLEDSLSSKSLIIKTKELDRKYQIEKKEQQILLQETELFQKNTTIALLAAVLGGIIIAIFTFYLWNRQKKLKQEKENSMNFTKQLLQNTEEERKRIAGDLHDSISHELLNLKSIFSQDISVVNSKIDTIINDIRGISRNLHPVMFDKIGLIPNVEQLLERVQNQNNFFVSTELKYSVFLTSADELQIYRIIQEALKSRL